jgi:DNA polymerase-3 subunit delta'
MKFSEIIGQEAIINRLKEAVELGKIPHAVMFTGIEGCGLMPLAIAFAQYLLCQGPPPSEPDPMGLFGFDDPVESTPPERPCLKCRSCLMAQKLQHPDLHFMFPIYKKYGTAKPTYCYDFIDEWHNLLIDNPYFTYDEWMDAIGAENQQLLIYESESDEIFHKLSLVSSQGGFKICIVWLPEKMNETCANKMLKLIEEPPSNTIFIMASEHPEQLLQTIRSRVQTIAVPPIPENAISNELTTHYGLMEEMARSIAHSSQGSLSSALKAIKDDSDERLYFDLFVQIMRQSYMRKVREMKKWSEDLAGLGRERIKHFLSYCQRMVRENFIYNFHNASLNYMREQESSFAVKFAPFINENNVIGIMNELSLCERDVAQNANAKIVFFDFALKLTVLIKNR